MSKRRTDFRALKARRDTAMARNELLLTTPKAPPVDPGMIAAAIAAGKLTKVPPQRPRR